MNCERTGCSVACVIQSGVMYISRANIKHVTFFIKSCIHWFYTDVVGEGWSGPTHSFAVICRCFVDGQRAVKGFRGLFVWYK